MLIKKRI